MSHAYNKRVQSCNACGQLLAPFQHDLCSECQRDLRGGYGEGYPRDAGEYSERYETQAFDSCEVNEAVR